MARSFLVRLLGAALLAVPALAMAGRLGTAAADTNVSLLKLTGSSAGCATSTQTSGNEANFEPFVAVNPATAGTDHANIIGVWMQSRQGTAGPVAAASFDAGKTWSLIALPFSDCAGPSTPYPRSSDPWVSFGPDGTAYASAMGLAGSDGTNALQVAMSRDGGKTWTYGGHIIADKISAFIDDKPSITADPVNPGVAYLTWSHTPASWADVPGYTGAIFLSKTTDGGKTWSRPMQVVPGTVAFTAIGDQIVIDPRTGALYLVYGNFASTVVTKTRTKNVCRTVKGRKTCKKVQQKVKETDYMAGVGFLKSTDGGSTWSRPQQVGTMLTAKNKLPDTWPYDDDVSQCLAFPNCYRTGSRLPEAALDPSTGKIYVVWPVPHPTSMEIEIASSGDGGAHWTAPLSVSAPAGRPAFTPSIAVNSKGVVAVTYYTHSPASKGAIPTDYWLRSSSDGGAHFSDPIHLGGPFDHTVAIKGEVGGGYFLGDYMGLAANGPLFQSIFIMTNSDVVNSRMDTFTASVSP